MQGNRAQMRIKMVHHAKIQFTHMTAGYCGTDIDLKAYFYVFSIKKGDIK